MYDSVVAVASVCCAQLKWSNWSSSKQCCGTNFLTTKITVNFPQDYLQQDYQILMNWVKFAILDLSYFKIILPIANTYKYNFSNHFVAFDVQSLCSRWVLLVECIVVISHLAVCSRTNGWYDTLLMYHSLGCGIGYGYLHRIPTRTTESTSPKAFPPSVSSSPVKAPTSVAGYNEVGGLFVCQC